MSVSRTILHRLPIPELPGYESRMVRLEYPPGAIAPPHTHPVQGSNVVIEGEVVSQYEGSDDIERIKVGGTFVDRANVVHRVSNGSQTERFVVIVNYVIKVDEANVTAVERV